jgi:hypothetical protein
LFISHLFISFFFFFLLLICFLHFFHLLGSIANGAPANMYLLEHLPSQNEERMKKKTQAQHTHTHTHTHIGSENLQKRKITPVMAAASISSDEILSAFLET